MMKRVLLIFFMAVTLSVGAKADTYFQYPIVPDSISNLQDRCDYLARHFWDFCDLKKAFSSRQKMAQEFSVYLSILQNASADSAFASVERLTKKLEKQPSDLLFLTERAEAQLYSDTAEVWIDELYLPFIRAAIANKKIDKASKARFAHQETILSNSLPGKTAPSLPYTDRNGLPGNLDNDSAQVVVLFFNDPDCSDCNLARIRLHADISASELIEAGTVKVVSIALTEPDESWRQAVADYPETWIVTANPDADLTFDLRSGTPEFYVLDKNHKIRFKHLGIDQLLDIFRQLKRR
ncbi:MAG: DUF5106 domain-containing protein [Duncaniella sp.]|nr:DUF5106 domain-containing protein [Duncaniella sp.]